MKYIKHGTISKEFLETEFIQNKKSASEIASILNRNTENVYYYLNKYNLRRKNYKDLYSYVFGKLTVLKYAGHGNNGAMWECECECGKIGIYYAKELTSNRRYSCGCAKVKFGKKSHKWTGYEEISGCYWYSLQRGAKARNIEFNITIEYAWKLFLKQNRKCILSNVELQFKSKYEDPIKGQTASLDRIDSTKSYIEDNVQWVHQDINKMKWDLIDEKFIDWCRLVSYNHSQYPLEDYII